MVQTYQNKAQALLEGFRCPKIFFGQPIGEEIKDEEQVLDFVEFHVEHIIHHRSRAPVQALKPSGNVLRIEGFGD